MAALTLDKIPSELRQTAQWLVWRQMKRGSEVTKVPFQTDRKTNAKSNAADTWTTFDEIRCVVGTVFQPGFVFSQEDPFCGVDLDGCRDPKTGECQEWARNIVRILDSYTEVSPSGTGLKVFIKASLSGKTGRKIPLDYPKTTDKTPGIEIYDQGRFFAVTGQRIAGLPQTVEERQAELDELMEVLWPSAPQPVARRRSVGETESDIVERARRYVSKMEPAISGSGGHGRTFAVACVLVLGFGLSEADAMGVMWEYNTRCDPEWTERELLHKVTSAAKQPGERNYLRHALPTDWASITIPQYVSAERTPAAATTAPAALPVRKSVTMQSVMGDYIESVRRGPEVLVKTGLIDLDFAVGGGFAFGEMVIVAGRPSHGKSVVGLQFCRHWTDLGYPCLYVSEEMSVKALAKRTALSFSTRFEADWVKNPDALAQEAERHFDGRAECHIVEQLGTIDAVLESIDWHVAEKQVRCVVIDYAQLLRAKGKDVQEQIRNVSIALRHITTKHKLLLVPLCQLSRAIEGRTAFVPKMSDLKETGQLEQDADVIMFNVWPCMVDNDKPKEEYKFYIAKNRNREIRSHVVQCFFDAGRQTVRLAGHHVRDDADVPFADQPIGGGGGFFLPPQ